MFHFKRIYENVNKLWYDQTVECNKYFDWDFLVGFQIQGFHYLAKRAYS